MKITDLLEQTDHGEDSTRQFKADVRNAESLASEMAAFANCEGGTIYVGVVDAGSKQDIEKIRAGNSNIRNPILVSYVAKGLLPYHGLGSGIKRALEDWPGIDFADDRDGCLFTATVHRKPVEDLTMADKTVEMSEKRRKSVGKTSEKILNICRKNSSVTIAELAAVIGVSERSIERNLQNLQKDGLLLRIGGRKEGHWEVLE